MSKVQLFNFGSNDIRVVERDGQPWFVANDVRAVLGVVQAGTNFSFLNADEMAVVAKGSGISSELFLGTSSKVKLLSESGLYKFTLRSTKPQAKAFQDWVAKVVLPAIRKDALTGIFPDKEIVKAKR